MINEVLEIETAATRIPVWTHLRLSLDPPIGGLVDGGVSVP
jgi:hypothetical protein